MKTKLNLGSTSSIMTVATASVAAFIAVSILATVVNLFQSRGAPMQRLAAAERACASHTYQSERQACMKQWLAQSAKTNVADR
jgi:hypothetical protein